MTSFRLIDLSGQAMIGVSHQWLTVDRPTMESDPNLKTGLALIEAAHGTLVSTQQQLGNLDRRIAELTAKLGIQDRLHDRKGRGVFRGLEAAVDLADSEEEAAPYIVADEALFPLGLAVIQRSYREQAGAAVQARSRLTPGVRAALAAVTFHGRTLLEETETWLETARVIGELQAERARISGDDNEGAVSRGDLRDARQGWMQAVRAMLLLLDFTNLDTDARRRLLADLRDAEARARKPKSGTPAIEDDAVDTELEEDLI